MSTTVFTYEVMQPYAEGEEHSTLVSVSESGREVRQARWSQGLFVVTQAALRFRSGGNSLSGFRSFFAARQGRYDTFLYKPQQEMYHLVTAEAVGTGTGSNKVFYLDSKYIDSSTLLVYLTGVLQTTGYTFSGNNTTPTITFSSAPGNGVAVTATYERYYPCRFDSDTCSFLVMAQGSSDSNAILETRLTWSQDYPGSHLV